MATLYRIREWAKHFECNRTREIKTMTWVPLPTKQDGDGYTELLDHPDGSAHYGVWCSLVGVAAKSQVRGSLLRQSGMPHDFGSLARITRHAAGMVESAIRRLVAIGWLESLTVDSQDVATTPHAGATPSQEGASSSQVARACDTTEQDITEQDRTDAKASCPPGGGRSKNRTPAFERWYRAYPRKVKPEAAARAYQAALKRIAAAQQTDRHGAAIWLLGVTESFAASPVGQGGSWCPHPASWLNAGSYDDDPAEWQREPGEVNRAKHKREKVTITEEDLR